MGIECQDESYGIDKGEADPRVILVPETRQALAQHYDKCRLSIKAAFTI